MRDLRGREECSAGNDEVSGGRARRIVLKRNRECRPIHEDSEQRLILDERIARVVAGGDDFVWKTRYDRLDRVSIGSGEGVALDDPGAAINREDVTGVVHRVEPGAGEVA